MTKNARTITNVNRRADAIMFIFQFCSFCEVKSTNQH